MTAAYCLDEKANGKDLTIPDRIELGFDSKGQFDVVTRVEVIDSHIHPGWYAADQCQGFGPGWQNVVWESPLWRGCAVVGVFCGLVS